MKYALLCPGQGAQAPGFLDAVLGDAPELLAVLVQTLQRPAGEIRGLSGEALRANAIAQPCIMAAQLERWSRLAPLLPTPAIVMGYSLGELTAFVLANGCPPSAALALAKERATAMDRAFDRPCAMLAVRGLMQPSLGAICAEKGWHLAIRNGEDRFVVAGERAGAAEVEAAALAAGASVTVVGVTTPSHTPLLADAVAPFSATLEELRSDTMAFPLISASDGALVRRAEEACQRLAFQLAAPLDWAGAMDSLVERGIGVCLELGPGADLSRMLRERHPQISVRSVCEFSSPASAANWLQQEIALNSP
jgi:[acyl-carrier-protein] S-malonyltransferase